MGSAIWVAEELTVIDTNQRLFSSKMKTAVMLAMVLGISCVMAQAEEATVDPWAPCQNDSDCPDHLMCNIYQSRCTECVYNEDCPPCMEDDCPHQGEGVCVYGDHCCRPENC